MNIPYVFKRCSKCGKRLVASSVNFHKQEDGKYGLRGQCKECRKKYTKKRYKANKETILEYQKKRYKSNKETILEYQKEYYKSNKETLLERCKEYKQTPQGQIVKFNSHNRRRTKEQNQGKGITKEQWLEMMNFFGWKCAYSGKYLGGDSKDRTIDHIEPLNNGGANEIWNCVPMDRSLNCSKCDKEMLEWYTKQPFYSHERLLKIYEWQEYVKNKIFKK